jgi:hypothetical protein
MLLSKEPTTLERRLLRTLKSYSAEMASDDEPTNKIPANMQGLLTLVQQMRQSVAAGLYMPAIMVALTLPDVMGALGSEDGKASGSKYRTWLSDHAGYPADDAVLIWGIRCSLLHQGRANKGDIEVAFTVPGTGQLHKLSIEAHDGVRVAWYSIEGFVEDIAAAVIAWLERFALTARAQRNLERFARLRPEGVSAVHGPVLA